MSRQDFQRKMARISPAVDWTGFATCDLVIEAVLERMDVKRQVLDEAEAVLREDAIFATNTSSLLVSEIAEGARRPERVVGLHFFNPAPRMPLVEVVAGRKTGPEVLAASASFVARLGKVPVIVRDGPVAEDRDDLAARVGDRECVGEMVGEPAQRPAGLLRRLAGLEQVADDERHAETAADDLAPAKGQ